MRDASRCHRGATAERVGVRVRRARDAEEDADLPPSDLRRVVARALECFPGRFEQQAMLRIEGACLACVEREESGVESVRCVEESAAAGVALSRRAALGM